MSKGRKGNIIKTECGLEKQCTCCGEYYPISHEFFYRNGKGSNGQQLYVAQCIDCYVTNYRPERRKSERVA